MQVSFDWQQIYGQLVSQSSRPPKSAFAAARQIENDIFEEGWPAGEVFGDQAHLIHRYGFSRATLREAVRLLEDRHVAHMRRGPGGGLIILPMSRAAIAPAVADYFHATGVAAEQIQRARTALRIAEAYRGAYAEGPEALRRFTNEFRSRITDGSGAGLLDGRSWTFRCATQPNSNHVFTDLFGACLDAIEDRSRAQGDSPPHPPVELQQGLAHSLARKLMLELHNLPMAGTQRVGTEDQLCERHHVGREVLRQAIRVLESRGVIDSQRGRTHGLHAGVSDAAPLVELVVAYLSSIGLKWSEFETVARILSRIVRLIVAAESTPGQRRELLRRMERIDSWGNSPSLITAQLHSEWGSGANPFLVFMEQCATAYCARSSAAIWRCFDDAALPTLKQLQIYMVTSIRGDLVQADRLVNGICDRISALRGGDMGRVAAEPQVAVA
jgi:DNA-binding FadR family transcriptional regulator